MDGSYNLYEVWTYDEYLDVFVTIEKAKAYIKRLIDERVYLPQDLWIREVIG